MKHEFLNDNGACEDGYEFAIKYKTLRDAWDNCERGDWMAWYAERAGVDKRILTLVAGLCAETVIHLMKDDRSVKAVKAAIAYGKGEIDDNELEYATSDAANAAWAAKDASVASAVSAANAAWAASDVASDAASDAAWAASEAWAARAAASAACAEINSNQKQTAEICRKYLTDKIKW